MTKEEALAQTYHGHKITHTLFDSKEYLYRDEDGRLRTEDGYKVTQEFWSLRDSDIWEGGWSIYNGPEYIPSKTLMPGRKSY